MSGSWFSRMPLIFKIIIGIFFGVFLFQLHLLILVLAHTFLGSISNGIGLEAAIDPLYYAVEAEDWIETYLLFRETVLCELPLYPIFDMLLIEKSSIALDSVLVYDVAKLSLSALLFYILCRINKLISSEKHPIIFSALISIWTSLSTFSSMVAVKWLTVQGYQIGIVSCIALSVACLFGVGFLSYLSINKLGVKIKIESCLISYGASLLISTLDSVVYFFISCFSFDVLQKYIPDGEGLISIILFAGVFVVLIYTAIKKQFLPNL